MSDLTHIDEAGRARMVDVSAKASTARRAVAEGRVRCSAEALAMAVEGRAAKGSVIATAELAGIMGAKRTAELIPLCHPLPLSKAGVTITADPDLPGFRVTGEAATTGPTGVEMEALTAVSVACLTLYDMLKAVDRSMTIEGVRLLEKEGGRSGHWRAIDE
ncbi:cyclic pyranopterin monophosphate synthase MoaC [Sphingomonas sp. LY160]|uniref:cyclic pyranopterin monophosphate synthase MoaC n=1 Tax=Sphingomonas sp. LY160 TaxID=3095342 RepID=UPI002ADEAB3A|nr:cyclic pyranopterin monophosphate synthase MoaC [Sphingomonas sp. LY160]MEA1072283.1 cyclic pyranopterin monophosphate synthase MoaC [Sphingomonas sp. LY160]